MSTEINSSDPQQASSANPAELPSPGIGIDAGRVSVVVTRQRPSGRPRWHLGATLGVAVVVVFTATSMTQQVRWRVQTLALALSGRIPDIDFADLLAMLMPGSGQTYLSRLPGTRNPYPLIQVPPLTQAQWAAAPNLYASQCAGCHGSAGAGAVSGAPALVGRTLTHGETPWAIYRTIRYGVAGTAMAPHPLERRQLWELVAYIRSLRAAHGSSHTPARMTAKLEAIDVPYAELARTAYAKDDWLTYGGSYAADRFSALTQINVQNVSKLALRWLYPFRSEHWSIECSPLVRAGIVYVTGPDGEVMALDALTGAKLWEHDHRFERLGKGEGPVGQNRGVALLGRRVFVASWDSTLSALSAASGKVLWERRVGPYPGTWISAAPLAYRNLVVVGVTTPPVTGRGYLAAYDVRTGKLRWRFETIPGPGQPGHDTWNGSSWEVGGAGPWMTGSYDAARDVLYWGIGGARPDFDPSTREGDDLYSDSLVAIQGSTGRLLWYFQSTPGDTHDWDAVQVPLIADRVVDGRDEQRLLWANRNGFYYVVDRTTGAFIHGVPFVHENWASGLDARGRPILMPASRGLQGRVVFPSAQGATNWWPPSYDPDLGLTFIPVLVQGMTFFPTHESLPRPELSFRTAIRAVDAYSGKLVWEHGEPKRRSDLVVSGLLSTRGRLVFGAADNQFFALDAQTGETLWSAGIGGTTYAAPVTFAVAGQQFVSVVIGRSLLTFALPSRPSRSTQE